MEISPCVPSLRKCAVKLRTKLLLLLRKSTAAVHSEMMRGYALLEEEERPVFSPEEKSSRRLEVNLSVVYGSMPRQALHSATERGVDRAKGVAPGERVPFFACGLSSVMYPKNPFAPTMHFNYRYFETDGGVWWFGGGTDITPSYVNEDDMKHFHGTYKEICDKHDPTYYKEFKGWADRYFLIKHRNETRGLGGIFFDDQNNKDPDEHFAFSEECVNSVIKAYGPIVEKHKDDDFTEQNKEWQLMRRGRYVEFNLVYDRGTVFGLKTGGRIESIFMSLPETARWEYNHVPKAGSPEADFIDACQNSREWV